DSWISTDAPTPFSAVATFLLPRARSMKKTKLLSGFELEFRSDGVFDLEPAAGIVLRQGINGLTGLVSSRDHSGRYASTDQHGAPERNIGIDHHNLRLIERILASEGIELQWGAQWVPVYATEMRFEQFAQRKLTIPGCVDEFSKLLDEQVEAIRLEIL